jgi:hypothetical protein
MAVPYPPDGPFAYSQDKEHRVSVATKVIEAAIDELPSWAGRENRPRTALSMSGECALG